MIMTEQERKLAEKYIEYIHIKETANTNAYNTKLELAKLSPHKVGEIVRWMETNRVRSGGTACNPVYKELPPKERMAVCVRVEAVVDNYKELDVHYRYEFHPVNKDGSISKNCCYIQNYKYEWTGKYHRDYENL